MNLNPVIIVARKELIDGFRDKRAIYSMIFGALFGPLLIGYMLTQEAKQQRAAQEITIPVVGKENSPMLVHWLGQQAGVEIKDGPADAEKAVRDQTEDIVLVIKKEFAEKFSASRPAPVQIVSDSNRTSAIPKERRLRSLLTSFSAEMGGLRLVARGVNPSISTALKIEDVEISSAQQRIARLFNFIPLFVIMAAFTAGMTFATDTTAGERERLSLEPLLINPVPRWQLVAGKWLASVAAATLSMAATLAITAKVLSRLSLEDLGVRFHLGLPEGLLIFAAVCPVALLIPALQIYLACFAKTFKEAQTYMSFLILGAIAPTLISTFHPLGNNPALKLIPFLGQSLLAGDVMGDNIPPVWLFVASAITAIALATVFLWLATRLFSSEKIIFGR
jgi:sodium transport system permease protein